MCWTASWHSATWWPNSCSNLARCSSSTTAACSTIARPSTIGHRWSVAAIICGSGCRTSCHLQSPESSMPGIRRWKGTAMTRHTKQSLFLFGLVIPAAFFGAASVHAYINYGMSLEWLCTFKPVIVHAEVVSVANRKVYPEGKFEFADVVCKPLEFLKGKAGERFEFKFDGYGPAGAPGTKYLLFLDRNDEKKDDKKLEVVYWINLDNPCTRMKGVAYTKDGNIVADGADILKMARNQIKRNLPGHRSTPRLVGMQNSFIISAPGPAAMALWAGSVVYFYVPPDPIFRERFHRIFRMNNRRQHALWDTAFSLVPLSYYKDDETVAILKKALSDPRSRRYRIHKGNKTETIDI